MNAFMKNPSYVSFVICFSDFFSLVHVRTPIGTSMGTNARGDISPNQISRKETNVSCSTLVSFEILSAGASKRSLSFYSSTQVYVSVRLYYKPVIPLRSVCHSQSQDFRPKVGHLFRRKIDNGYDQSP
jgi:hypothetical protein